MAGHAKHFKASKDRLLVAKVRKGLEKLNEKTAEYQKWLKAWSVALLGEKI